MPIMPRHDKRATKIAFNILGTPSNLKKRDKKDIRKQPNIKTDIIGEQYQNVYSR